MAVEHREGEQGGSFVFEEEGEQLAEMSYRRREGNIVILHTEVDARLQGRGIGQLLVAACVGYARDEQTRIVPVCSYARAVLKKNEDYHDVVAE